MKIRRSTLLFLAVLFLPSFGCGGGSDETMQHEGTAMGGMQEHREAMHGDQTQAADQAHGEMMEGADQHSEEHMQHMAEVREKLKKELGDAYDKPVPPATADDLALGRDMYQRNCASCHGDDGRGDGPAAAGLTTKPSDFTDPEHADYYSDQARLAIIRNGIPGTPMIGFSSRLSDDEIRAVFDYIRSLKGTGGGGETG